MKRIPAAVLTAAFFLSAAAGLGADTALSGMVKLFSSVYLQDHASGTYFSHGAGEFGLRRLEVRFSLAGRATDRVGYGLRLDGFATPEAMSLGSNSGLLPESESTGAPLRSEPFDLVLTEAWVAVEGLVFKNLDLTVGRQRLSWGTADKVGVVDNLNPVDLANFFTFDPDHFAERRPQTAVNLEYHFGPTGKLQLVWLLERQYSPLPRGFTDLLRGDFGSAAEVHVASREPLLRHTNLGFRLSTVVAGTDVGLTYYRGNFPLPVLTGLSFTAAGCDLRYDYPGQQVLGADLAGEALGIGFWAEAAYVVPESIRGSVSRPVFVNGGLVDFVTAFPVFERGWLRAVLGADTTLSWGTGLYLNLQYVRGFFDEGAYADDYKRLFQRGRGMFFGELEDYVLGRAEYKLLRGDLKLELGGLVEAAGGA
ncbi:MAG: hypothetical protein FJY83_04595, partial [Candidatus Aminicenantes bacterium]|nr:hypothetical protein [Candidatus Aminicenantes bacterium]